MQRSLALARTDSDSDILVAFDDMIGFADKVIADTDSLDQVAFERAQAEAVVTAATFGRK